MAKVKKGWYATGSFVGLGQAVCPVCGVQFDSGEVLVHKRMKNVFPPSGKAPPDQWKLCEEHQALYNDGYIAFIGCDPEKSELEVGEDGKERGKLEGAYHTGNIAFVRARMWDAIFGEPAPRKEDGSLLELVLCDDAVVKTFRKMMDDLETQEEGAADDGAGGEGAGEEPGGCGNTDAQDQQAR